MFPKKVLEKNEIRVYEYFMPHPLVPKVLKFLRIN
jgi:hypothetical protein